MRYIQIKDPAPNGIDGTTKLAKSTRESIRERILQIEDNVELEGDHGYFAAVECRESWADTLKELHDLLENPTHSRLAELHLANEELELFREEDSAVKRDLAKADRINAKVEWDQFIAEGGDPDSFMVIHFGR